MCRILHWKLVNHIAHLQPVQLPCPDTSPVVFPIIKIQYACGTTDTLHETHMFCLIESIDSFTYVVALVQVKRCFETMGIFRNQKNNAILA